MGIFWENNDLCFGWILSDKGLEKWGMVGDESREWGLVEGRVWILVVNCEGLVKE